MIIVDGLNEWLHFRAFVLSLFGHAACDLGGIAFYACDEGVGEWVGFRAGVEGLYDHDLLASIVSRVPVAAPFAVRIELKWLPFCQHISLG